MNSIIREYYPIFEMYQSLRNQLMEMLSDEDLGYHPPGTNDPLGVHCRQIGEVEQAYIDSFRTFTIDFSFRNPDNEIAASVSALNTWYTRLDEDLRNAVEALSEDAIDNRQIDRGGGFLLSPQVQLGVYQEALLIFYGKTSVYLKAIGKTLPQQWKEWIG